MTVRLNFFKANPAAMHAFSDLDRYLAKTALAKSLVNLVRLRASQINQCAYCVDLHFSEAKKDGETDRRLANLATWNDTPFFSAAERAALAWTEALTNIQESHAPDSVFELARSEFSESDLVELSLVIAHINMWNRFGVGFRTAPK